MKKLKLLLLCAIVIPQALIAQNVGIGTLTPVARLHVTDSSVLFSAVGNVPATIGLPPIQGTGRRMMWYSDKAAFRAGYVSGPNWDKDSIGKYSFAVGFTTKALGEYSVAIGLNTNASGQASFAAGLETKASNLSSTALGTATKSSGWASFANGNVSTASGDYSFASGNFSVASGTSSLSIGSNDTASGNSAIALGTNSKANGLESVAIGNGSAAVGSNAIALGYYNIANADYSLALGFRTRAKGRYSTTSGEGTHANAWGAFSTGLYNDSSDTPSPFIKNETDRIFQLGNGDNNSNRSNAITILRNGNTGLGVMNPTEKFEVNGKIKTINLQVTNGAANGYLLSSDVSGNAGWIPPIANYWSANGNHIFNNNTGNVGIGTNAPQAKLHVADSNVVFTGSLTLPPSPVNPPISGAGTRMMWYPDKAAFRVGYVDGSRWDKDSIGLYSFAAGFDTKASSYYSTALGNKTTASNFYSTALGFNTTASGLASTAMGGNSVASGIAATAFGNLTIASGEKSTSMGQNSVASGLYSLATGYGTTASGESSSSFGSDNLAIGVSSTAFGFGNRSRGNFSSSFGNSLISKGRNCFTIGNLNDTSDIPDPAFPNLGDRIFQIGNSIDGVTRSNAMTVLRDGRVGIGTTTPGDKLSILSADNINTTNIGAFYANNLTQGIGIGLDEIRKTGTIANSNLHINAKGTGNLILQNSATGNVGIGNSTPGFPLNFALTLGDKISLFGNTGSTYGFGVQSNLLQIHTSAVGEDVAFGYGSSASFTETMRIQGNGKVGIGITTPNAPLAFTNTTGPKISLYEGSANSQYGFAVQSGQLQLYTDAVAAKISFGYYTSGLYTERMYLTNSTGILTVAGTNYPSDARYKKQITRLQNPLEKIMAINGVEYLMRTDEFPLKHFDDKLQVGLIAQEVEKILPQVVQTGEDGYKAIDYAKIVPLLVEGIKEQQKQIDELRRIVENLRKQ